MTTLVWLFFALACFFSGLVCTKYTKWKERKRFKKCLKEIDKIHNTAYFFSHYINGKYKLNK